MSAPWEQHGQSSERTNKKSSNLLPFLPRALYPLAEILTYQKAEAKSHSFIHVVPMAFNCHCCPASNERAERAVSTKVQMFWTLPPNRPPATRLGQGSHLSSTVILATGTRRPTSRREHCSWAPQGFHLPAIQAVSKGPLTPSSQVSAQTLLGIKKSSANLPCQKYKRQRTCYCIPTDIHRCETELLLSVCRWVLSLALKELNYV